MAAAGASIAAQASSSPSAELFISSHTAKFCSKRITFIVFSSRGCSPFTERHSTKPLRGGEIHQMLLSFAEAGATVLRLKGGDPLVFGRGGEEMDFLQQQGVQVRVVPGITAASGIAAELGIPLTHRGAATSVRFLTRHSRKGGIDPLHVEDQAADPDSTLVVYMGLATLPSLAAKLINSGLPADTPAAAVERGTTAYQRTVFATLQDLPSRVAAAKLESPTLIFIGRVVALSPSWPGEAVVQEPVSTIVNSLPLAA